MRAPSSISLRSEAGFTIVELLVSMIIGTVVLIASLTVLDGVVGLTSKVNSRVDAAQRGRTAMDLMVRDLRSQVCVGRLTNAATGTTTTDDSLLAGSNTSIDFYTDLGDGTKKADGTDNYPPTRRTLIFDPSAKTIVERIYVATGKTGAYVFPAAPTTTRTLVSDVVQDGTTPVFRFYAYDTATPPTPSTLLPSPLSTSDEQRAVKITIAFRAVRTGDDGTTTAAAIFQDDVFRRQVDPNVSDPEPECSA